MSLLQTAIEQTSGKPFFTSDVEGYLKIAGLLLTHGVVLWTIVKKKVASDVQLRNDINGLGSRVAALETDRTSHGTLLNSLDHTVQLGRQDTSIIASRVGVAEQAQRNIETLVRDGQAALQQRVLEIRDAVLGEQVNMRERIVRLEVVNDLRRLGLLKEGEP